MVERIARRWGWRLPLALTGSIIAAVQVAWLLAGQAWLAAPLERLYAGVFVGLVVGLILLLVSLLAPDLRHVLGRLAVCLVPLTSLLALSLGRGS
ncbi:hypothetical protein [Rhodospirillum rubrum]|uniref:Uncharacterized protein n=1 Tax=Rhodospirillum rubrum (strain ATCC 11170 / ATH 1.1.1 / DSM 467 / LMG 4362 / NCIMB 8255 / S1) TaxID=269796 RepID=Q2RW48_RHORT|nr:hypothetical protein [Rhodospirillum rubrum]ABC21647.1 conserved hypothetical protein [Rhodospirillum rubrum ATCC 11170]AEO47341.1 hypothetical protein F11_04355 [Rhodospirillum rubrum F11]QXG81313.1 hypothetical protein KUL73_04415 [Rhodospirillum rubrum]